MHHALILELYSYLRHNQQMLVLDRRPCAPGQAGNNDAYGTIPSVSSIRRAQRQSLCLRWSTWPKIWILCTHRCAPEIMPQKATTICIEYLHLELINSQFIDPGRRLLKSTSDRLTKLGDYWSQHRFPDVILFGRGHPILFFLVSVVLALRLISLLGNQILGYWQSPF